jgi:uncharacterized lipoprotein YajG
MTKKVVILQALLTLAACAMPQTVVRTPDGRPSLAVEGAPEGAVLFVDGESVGAASAYNGRPNVLLVEPGSHEIDVRDGVGNVLHRQKVFVESELKTIQVH